jgi:hypothetical protein
VEFENVPNPTSTLPKLGITSFNPGTSIMASDPSIPQDGGARRSAGVPRVVPWAKSEAKQLLCKLLADESSYVHASGMGVDEIYNSDPLFKQYKIENFKTNYRNLSAKLKVERSSIEFDQEAFEREKQKFPRKDQTERGYKFWDGHQAQQLMRDDVKNNLTTSLKPSILREMRSEYQEFPLEVLRQHKYQEERRQRENVYWQKKRNDKARAKHEKYLRMQHLDS